MAPAHSGSSLECTACNIDPHITGGGLSNDILIGNIYTSTTLQWISMIIV